MKPLRVVVTTGIFPPDIGGPATHAEMLMQGLPALGIEPSLLSFGSLLGIPRGLRHLRFLAQVLAHGREADVLYALDPVSVGLPTMLASRILRRPFVLRVGGDYAWEQAAERFGVEQDLGRFLVSKHGWKIEQLKRVERWVARGAVRVIVPDRAMGGVMEQWNVRPDVTLIVPNAVDVSCVQATRQEARRLLHAERTLVLSMGRLLRWKGFEGLIDAVAALRDEIPGLRLAIIGGGPQAGALASKVMRANLDGTVMLLGRLPHDEAMLHLRAADLFVLNSAGEGMAHSILEAMALGTPVLATRAGGTPDLIEHGVTGWLVTQGDAADLTASIRELLRNPQHAARLAEAARRTAGRFNEDRMVREIASVLRSVL